MALLGEACTRAVREWRWINASPMRGTQLPDSDKARSRLIDGSEIEALRGVAGADVRTVNARAFLAFSFALETALRAGEICALDWIHVYPDKRTLTVSAEKVGARKSGKSRVVPLSNAALNILENLRGFDSAFVFGLTPRSLDSAFRYLREKAGLSGFCFHDSRALALTRMSKKLNPLQLAKVAGHTDLAMLTKVYYRENPGDWAELLD